jgi:predicted MFS family arabinose efflux permease
MEALNHKNKNLHYGWVILTLAILIVVNAQGLARFGYTMILPSMQEGLGLSNTRAGALATGNFCGYLLLALIAGFLASRFSPRRVIAISLFIVGLTMMLTATSRSFASALLWRTLTGMGSGGCFVPAMGVLAAWFAQKRRGMATGIAVGGSSVGLIITGPLVPWLLKKTGQDGWRLAWVALGCFGILSSIAIRLFLRDKPDEMGLTPIGAGRETEPPRDMNPSEKVSSWRQICTSSEVRHLAFIYSTFGFSYIIFTTFFAKYLQSEAGFSREAAGKLWGIVGWLSITCGLLWGGLSDILGRRQALLLVSLLQGCVYISFALWRTPNGALFASLLFGLTAWSIPAIMAAACGDCLGARLVPAALGFITLFFGIAQALGPVVAGLLADRFHTFVPSFLTAACVIWLGAADTFFLHKKRMI